MAVDPSDEPPHICDKMARTAITTFAILLSTSACTKEQVCFPDYQDCPGEETGDTGEEADYTCFDTSPHDFSWCVDNISAVEQAAVSGFLANQPWGSLGYDDYKEWDPERECTEVLLEHECLGGVLLHAKTCAVCWTGPSSPYFNAAGLYGPVAINEVPDNTAVRRWMPRDGWSDALMQVTAPSVAPYYHSMCQKVSTQNVRTGAQCLCTSDYQCPQELGEGICEGGVCLYTEYPTDVPALEPGPYLYGLAQWSDGLSCGTGNTCTLTDTLIANLHVLVTWWEDDVQWSINPTNGYITIDALSSDSLPYQLGVRQGDVIVAVDGNAPTAEAVNDAIDSLLRNNSVPIVFMHRTLALTL